jgi:16S rRNA processing protein RimM
MGKQDWLEGYTIIGEIQKPHGVRGDIKVRSETDDPSRFGKVNKLFLANPRTKHIKEVHLESFRVSGETLFLRLEEFNAPEPIAEHRFNLFCILDEERAPLEEGQFYLSDLEGLPVLDQNDEEIGTVLEVIEYPANDVFEIQTKTKKILAPWVDDCIIDISLEDNFLKIDTDFLGDMY